MDTPMNTIQHSDFLIIGAGIAGASAAWHLAPWGVVQVIEREAQPGYHSSGRSAAMFMESYGNAQVRALTRASRAFLQDPPPGFAEHPLLHPRGCLTVAAPGQEARLQQEWQQLRPHAPGLALLDGAAACALVPALRPERVAAAILDPDATDLDAHALLHGFLRGAKRQGARITCDAEVTAIRHISHMCHHDVPAARHDGQDRQGSQGCWQVQAGGQCYQAPVLINAAGAWADHIATLAGVDPIGLQPMRRSAFTLKAPADMPCAHWPMVVDVDEQWYFKPDAGQLLASPANADPTTAHDVQPEDIDIATGLWHLQERTTLDVRRPTHTWAGLRSFVSDGGLVIGFANQPAGFFWLAAQGGYGIQTSVAAGCATAALARHQPLPPHLLREGLTPAMLGPQRLLI